MVGLHDVEKILEDMYNRLHIIPACVGQTDRETLPRHSPRYAYVSRGKKSVDFKIFENPDMPNWIGYANPNCSMKVYCTGLYTMNQTVTLGACVYCMLTLLLLSEP